MKKIKFLSIAAALGVCILTQPAHAGFLTGVVVGSVMSGDKKTYTGSSTVVSSDKEGRDVIACPARLDMEKPCRGPYYSYPTRLGGEESRSDYTPGAFAYKMGYKTIHQQSVMITPDGQAFILMEVSK